MPAHLWVCCHSRLSAIGMSGQAFVLSHGLASSEQKPIVRADDQACRNRESDRGSTMHKVVAKITGVLYRATGAGLDLRLKHLIASWLSSSHVQEAG